MAAFTWTRISKQKPSSSGSSSSLSDVKTYSFKLISLTLALLMMVVACLAAVEEAVPVEQYKDSGESFDELFVLPELLLRPGLDEQSMEESKMDKRGAPASSWNKLHGGWGKRDPSNSNWNRMNGVWGKRSPTGLDAGSSSSLIGFPSSYGMSSSTGKWNQLNNLWGKRSSPSWNSMNQMWGKRGWNDMNGGWGRKRAVNHWNNLRGMWG